MATALPPDVASALAAHFPVTVQDGELSVEGARLEGTRIRATVRLTTRSGGEVVDLKEQSDVDLGPADPAQLAQRVAVIRERLETYDLPISMPAEIARERVPFCKAKPSAGAEPARRRREVLDALRDQANTLGFENRAGVVEEWPAEARTAYFLDLADSILGGQGLQVFLDGGDVLEAMGILDALDAAGCEQMAQQYRLALGLVAAENTSQLLDVVDLDWLEQEQRNPAGRTWEQIDSWEQGGTYWLVKEELQPVLASFVDANHASLSE